MSRIYLRLFSNQKNQMIKKLLIASIFSFVISFLSCSKKEYTEDGIKQICAGIDSVLHNVEGEEFDWGSANAYSYFTAYFHDSDFVFINEKLKDRGDNESFNRYYIYNFSAIQVIQKKIEYVSDENNIMHKSKLSLTIYITPSGDVVMYDKLLNGKREQLTGEESAWIYKHSQELISIVKNRSKILKAK